MAAKNNFDIAVFPGDGIGPEIMNPCLTLLNDLATEGRFGLNWQILPAGADHYRRSGKALPQDSLDRAEKADAILLAAMGLPRIRYPDGREIAPQLDLREAFQLYAGVRPVRSIPGAPGPLADPRAKQLDFVLIRESTEGLFAGRLDTQPDNNDAAMDKMVITRPACERLFDFAFNLARQRREEGRPGKTTCVDKANVLGSTAFFRKIFDERAALFPELEADHCYVDAMALRMVQAPWNLDVLVTENMFGDILSDLGAGLMGGLGMAPSADIGDRQAVFQPCHGSAPDIAGQGKANPTAMFLSAAMMLDWLGRRHDNEALVAAGAKLTRAVETSFVRDRLLSYELGGTDGTEKISNQVRSRLAD